MEAIIVDDDEMTVFLNEIFVKENDFHQTPHSFNHGKSFLDYLLANYNPEEKYCVFLDINMPVMDGWEFLDAIKEESMSKNIYVVILTSSVNEIDREKARGYTQVIDFLEKPLNDVKLNLLKKNEQISSFF
ncbi:response regulator [Marivirga sp. S37H4]|uniref:Response regulator n=1 Tax=Marivirga aurantiaca TaxID=2802615 RepID=A0A934WYE5_9BACT|nr:response regulator [Marivirga aurantiaca]MBK6265473.1 response regulator [Marivirga aurantiaca]